jgi:CSLREA domain-containing protein
MVSHDAVIRPTGLESITSVQGSAVAQTRALLRIRALLAVAMAATFVLALKTATASATTYTVNILDDSNGNGDCSVRDAINAANGVPTSGSTCTIAGTGNDAIQFSVSGTITVSSNLPTVTGSLTLIGPITLTRQTAKGEGTPPIEVIEVESTATLNLQNITIANSGNGANIGTGSGCIANRGILVVTNSTFSNNSGDFNEFGPGCISNAGTATVTNSTFSGNRDDGSLDNSGILNVTDCTFSGNVGRGNAALSNQGTATVTGSTFVSNGGGGETGSGAGAIGNGGTLTVTNTTFSANGSPTAGGAIRNVGSNPAIITNCTFSDNRADSSPGGAISGSANIKSSIFASNTSGVPNSGSCYGSITDAGYNIADDSSCGFSKTGSANNGDNVDPMLSSAGLANNGGPTETIALSTGSPAIDAIPVTDCTDQSGNPIRTNQRNMPRPDAHENVCDIGAYEVQDATVAQTFGGTPGKPNCHGVSVSALTHQYGNLNAAASSLGFPSVRALQNDITAYCNG